MSAPTVFRFNVRLDPLGYDGLPVERAGTIHAAVPADRPLAELLAAIGAASPLDQPEGAYSPSRSRSVNDTAPVRSTGLTVGETLVTGGFVVYELELVSVGRARASERDGVVLNTAGFDWDLAEEFVAMVDEDEDEDD